MDYIKILQVMFLALTILVLLGGIVYIAITFIKMPKSKQAEKVKEWLLFACAQAEQIYGSKTGLIKLRYVYDMFVTKFPWLAQVISFEYFSGLVDQSLEVLKEQLNNNETLNNLITGSDTIESKTVTSNK